MADVPPTPAVRDLTERVEEWMGEGEKGEEREGFDFFAHTLCFDSTVHILGNVRSCILIVEMCGGVTETQDPQVPGC